MSPSPDAEPELGPWSMLLLRAALAACVLTVGWFLVDAIQG